MSLATARAALARHGLGDRVRELPGSSATVELAAAAIGCAPARIAKTLSFLVDDRPVLVVMAGDGRVDNRRFKQTFGVKATMVPGDRVEELVGHGVGGCVRSGCTMASRFIWMSRCGAFPRCSRRRVRPTRWSS